MYGDTKCPGFYLRRVTVKQSPGCGAVVVRMLSFIKTEVNVSREVDMLDESLDGNQKS